MIKLITILFIFSMAYTPMAASAECKGSSKSSCENSNSCSWVSAHKRKNGAKVTAHCKSKGKKKAKKKKSKAKDSKSTKEDSKAKDSKSKKKDSKKSKKKKKKSKKSKKSKKKTDSSDS